MTDNRKTTADTVAYNDLMALGLLDALSRGPIVLITNSRSTARNAASRLSGRSKST
ncbi:hypothetical protein ACPPVO_36505 [Dactylosporangium sp. McL0621]|uniref:hypothetical protein n=1 Tax=Dactylosporangium sp. McL0621 TaxID=3415678 RepID=UPI003CEAD927